MPKTIAPPVPTRDELEALSLSELVALHNQYAERPVRKFRDRKTAVARVQAVLPKEPKPVSLVQRLIAVMQDHKPRQVGELAVLLDATPGQVRGALGGARSQGWQTLNTGPSTFALGVPQCAGPRCTKEG